MDPIEKLKSGYRSFRTGRFEERKDQFKELVDTGQSPSIALVGCSDSRIDPGEILQADAGELFMVRNVANIVPPYQPDGRYHGTSAALEYAVKHLKVENVLILGHAYCGGIQSLFAEPSEDGSGDTFIPPWTEQVRTAHNKVLETMPDASHEEQSRACEQYAILQSLENLRSFPFIDERVSSGNLSLHGWHIDIRECILRTYNSETRQFETVE